MFPLTSRLISLGQRVHICSGRVWSISRVLSSSAASLRAEEKVTVHFINHDGKKMAVNSLTGVTLLDLIVNQNLDFEGFGACQGTLACSTCHVVLENVVYEKLGPVADEEMDLLDLTRGLTPTSRLGCQVCLRKALDGMIVRVPSSVSNANKTTITISPAEA